MKQRVLESNVIHTDDTQVKLIDRQRGWEALDAVAGKPIIVATRNDDLAQVIARVPAHRQPDLVFVQNGMLRDFLADAGLATATRGTRVASTSATGSSRSRGVSVALCSATWEAASRRSGASQPTTLCPCSVRAWTG